MAVLTFDNEGTRYYEYGVRDVVFYPGKCASGNDGVLKTGVAWNGVSNLTESPTGADGTDLWADDIKYATLRGVESFEGSIQCWQTPAGFEACDGIKYVHDAIKVYQQTRSPFCLAYKTRLENDNGADDDVFKVHVIYYVTASPASRSRATVKDSPDAEQISYDVKAVPLVPSSTEKAAITGLKPYSHIEFIVDKKTTQTYTGAMTAAQWTVLENKLYGTSTTTAQIGDYTFLTNSEQDPIA